MHISAAASRLKTKTIKHRDESRLHSSPAMCRSHLPPLAALRTKCVQERTVSGSTPTSLCTATTWSSRSLVGLIPSPKRTPESEGKLENEDSSSRGTAGESGLKTGAVFIDWGDSWESEVVGNRSECYRVMKNRPCYYLFLNQTLFYELQICTCAIWCL